MSFLGVGGVQYGADHPLLASNSTTGRILRAVRHGFDELLAGRLDNLPASRLELTDASQALKQPNAVLLIGDDATETAFKRQPLGNFKILHLAVHAVAEPHFPERAALILGRDPNSDDDGLLQAREIASLPLTADLVTLSACDTAKGKLLGEEGNASLVQAFLLAGARSVVAALWEVEDRPTGTLMKYFYTHLSEGMDKASALRQAKLDLLNDVGDHAPQYWAGVYAGRGRSVVDYFLKMTDIAVKDREAILTKVPRLVEKKHFNPGLNGANWPELFERRKAKILEADTIERLETEIQAGCRRPGVARARDCRRRGWLPASRGCRDGKDHCEPPPRATGWRSRT
jgi:hypothetical protein